jgi:hypothetical protein
MHTVSYPTEANLNDVVSDKGANRTMLTEFFEANKKFEWARGIFHRDFPAYFVWVSGRKCWKNRSDRTQIGRIMSAHSAEGERHYLRVLLNHVTGATSFEDLRTINGIIFPMFCEAAEKRGLIEVVRLPKRGVLLRLITLSMSELVRPNVSRCHFHFEGYLPLF